MLSLDEQEELLPSRRYTKRMARLIRRQARTFPKPFNTIGKRAAALLVAASLVFALSMNVSAVRSSIVSFFTTIHEKFVEIVFSKETVHKAPDTIETKYTLAYIPTGYEQEHIFESDQLRCVTWSNAEGKHIIFDQYTLSHVTSKDIENSQYTEFIFNDLSVFMSTKHEERSYFWSNGIYAFNITIPLDFTREECLTMISSMTEYLE